MKKQRNLSLPRTNFTESPVISMGSSKQKMHFNDIRYSVKLVRGEFRRYAAENPATAFRLATHRATSTLSWLSLCLATDFPRLAWRLKLEMSSLE